MCYTNIQSKHRIRRRTLGPSIETQSLAHSLEIMMKNAPKVDSRTENET